MAKKQSVKTPSEVERSQEAGAKCPSCGNTKREKIVWTSAHNQGRYECCSQCRYVFSGTVSKEPLKKR